MAVFTRVVLYRGRGTMPRSFQSSEASENAIANKAAQFAHLTDIHRWLELCCASVCWKKVTTPINFEVEQSAILVR